MLSLFLEVKDIYMKTTGSKIIRFVPVFIMFIFILSFIPAITVSATSTQITVEEGEILPGESDEYNDYADTTLEGVSSRGTHIIGNSVKAIGDSISSQFAPGLKKFLNHFGVYAYDDHITDNYMTSQMSATSPVLNMNQIFGVIAYSIATLLFFIEIYKSVFTTVFGKAQSPLQCLARYAITVILITVSQQLISPIIDMFSSFWELTTTYTVINNVDVSSTLGIGGVVVGFVVLGFASAGIILAIIFIILLWILVKEVIKLVVEMLERYIVSCFLIIFAPMGFSFIGSPTTERVFTSYMTMFISQLFLLIINNLWLYSLLYLMVNVGFSISNYIFVLAWVKTGQKVDELLQSMGLSVAKTGGDLFDSLGSMVYAAKNMLGSNSLIGRAGQTMTNVGLQNGNPRLAAAGSTLANILSPAGRKTAEDMADAITRRGGSAADNAGILSTKAADFSKGHVDATIMDQFNTRGKSDGYMAAAFGKNWQESIAGKGGRVDTASLSLNNNGIVRGSMTDKDGNSSMFQMSAGGKNLQNASALGAALSGDEAKTASGSGWKIQYGKDGGMSSLNKDSVFNGEVGFNNFAAQIGTNTAELQKATGISPSKVSQISVSNGNAVLHGKNGETLGAVRTNGKKLSFADAQSAPHIAPLNTGGPMATDNTAQLRSGNTGDTHKEGVVMYPNSDGPQLSDFMSKYKDLVFTEDDVTKGEDEGNWIKLENDLAYNSETGMVYGAVYHGGDFADDALYVALSDDLNPSGIMEMYDDEQSAFMADEGIEYERHDVNPGISREDYDTILDDAVAYNQARADYIDEYSSSIRNAAANETEYLANRIADQENLWATSTDNDGNIIRSNSIESVDTEKHIFVSEDRGLGKQIYEYMVLVDDEVPKGWKTAGGGKGHNLIAYRRQKGKRSDD